VAAVWIANARLAGGPEPRGAVAIERGRIAQVAAQPPARAASFDARGLLLLPAFADAHVHLSVAGDLRAVGETLLASGVATVLDLGEPERLLGEILALAPLQVGFAGPLLTAPGGYPTQSWGASGYGLEVGTVEEARAAVVRLAGRGAGIVKLAFDARHPVLDVDVARAAADEAHRHGLLVAAHALTARLVGLAIEAGADVLAHAPIGPLPEELIRQIGARRLRVISTLHAWRGEGVDNLRRLQAAGARVVYGTDLGNEGTSPGIDEEEISLLAAAGLSPAGIVAASVEGAQLAGFAAKIAPGARADLVLVPDEALVEPRLLARCQRVWIAGGEPVRRGEA
jgi:imidazolonepropionase-like amidohydrolase